VLHAKSVQLSTVQYAEQPSQLFGVPGVSHDSGNSTAPFPHVGHGTRQAAGCDQLQGYLFSRPLPVAQMTEFIASRQIASAVAS